jgi:hypothetical protein
VLELLDTYVKLQWLQRQEARFCRHWSRPEADAVVVPLFPRTPPADGPIVEEQVSQSSPLRPVFDVRR